MQVLRRFFKPQSRKRLSKFRITPPLAAPDRAGLALVTIAKNEKHRIDEWIHFHKKAGVAHFFIYDNLSTDGMPQYLRSRYADTEITVIPWQLDAFDSRSGLSVQRQVVAYCHALCTFGGGFRWLAFIDIDEFIVPKQSSTLAKALEPLEDYSNISLPWTMFGFNGHQTPPPGGVIQNYRRRAIDRLPLGGRPILKFKCILDPVKVVEVGVHRFATSDMGAFTVNEKGLKRHNKLTANRDFLSSDFLQLNHYYTYSKSELEERLLRGAVSGGQGDSYRARVMAVVDQIERETVEDLSAIDFLSR